MNRSLVVWPTVGATIMLSPIAPVTFPCLYAWDWDDPGAYENKLKQWMPSSE